MSHISGSGGTLNGDTDVSINTLTSGNVLIWNGSAWANSTLTGGASNATTTSPGVVQLAGDLAGTYAVPTVPGLTNRPVRLLEVSGTYPARPSVTYAEFVGPDDPGSAAHSGDTWIATSS